MHIYQKNFDLLTYLSDEIFSNMDFGKIPALSMKDMLDNNIYAMSRCMSCSTEPVNNFTNITYLDLSKKVVNLMPTRLLTNAVEIKYINVRLAVFSDFECCLNAVSYLIGSMPLNLIQTLKPP